MEVLRQDQFVNGKIQEGLREGDKLYFSAIFFTNNRVKIRAIGKRYQR